MPETQNPHGLPPGFKAINNEVGPEREKASSGSFDHCHTLLRCAREGFGLRDQTEAKSFCGTGIVLGNRLSDLLKVPLTADREDYLPTHERKAWRSSSGEHPRPSSISRSASSSDASNSARSWSLRASNPNRRENSRLSRASRSVAGRRPIASSISVTVLINRI